MPLFGHQNTRGDLFIEYNVVLPVEVSSEMRLSEFSLNYLGHPQFTGASPKNSWTCFKHPRPHTTNYEITY